MHGRRATWGFGDGGGAVTSDPGRPWTATRSGSIGHTYEVQGAYRVVLHQIWTAYWRAGAAAWQPLGFFSTSGTRTYPVRQVVALLVEAR